MSARDLYAERQADLAREEIETLRELRDAVLVVQAVMRKCHSLQALTTEERQLRITAFDDAGMGPVHVVSPEAWHRIARLAAKAVTP